MASLDDSVEIKEDNVTLVAFGYQEKVDRQKAIQASDFLAGIFADPNVSTVDISIVLQYELDMAKKRRKKLDKPSRACLDKIVEWIKIYIPENPKVKDDPYKPVQFKRIVLPLSSPYTRPLMVLWTYNFSRSFINANNQKIDMDLAVGLMFAANYLRMEALTQTMVATISAYIMSQPAWRVEECAADGGHFTEQEKKEMIEKYNDVRLKIREERVKRAKQVKQAYEEKKKLERKDEEDEQKEDTSAQDSVQDEEERSDESEDEAKSDQEQDDNEVPRRTEEFNADEDF